MFFIFQDEKDLVHGNIRCRNILIFRKESTRLVIKLGDPGSAYVKIEGKMKPDKESYV